MFGHFPWPIWTSYPDCFMTAEEELCQRQEQGTQGFF